MRGETVAEKGETLSGLTTFLEFPRIGVSDDVSLVNKYTGRGMEYVKDFDRWNEKKKEAHRRSFLKTFYIYAREVWWCSVGVNIGSEMDGKNENFERPILVAKVFSQDGFLGIPLTSKQKVHQYAIPIHHGQSLSFANTSQLRIFSKKRLLRKVGMVNEVDFETVLASLRSFF